MTRVYSLPFGVHPTVKLPEGVEYGPVERDGRVRSVRVDRCRWSLVSVTMNYHNTRSEMWLYVGCPDEAHNITWSIGVEGS